MKLPKSIISKYGISKKAWQIFKSRASSTRKTKNLKGGKMRRRRSRRVGYRGRARRRYGAGLGTTAIVLGGGVYGALRRYISGAIAPITSKIPLGALADNVGMGIVSYLAYKKGSGIVKNAGMIGLGIEAAMAADDLMKGGLGGVAPTTSGNIF